VGVSGLGKNRRFWGVLVNTWQPIYPIFGVCNRLQPETGFKPVATDFPIAVAHHYLTQSVGTGAVSPGNASSRRVYCENGRHMQAEAAVEPVNARTAIELRPVLAQSFPPMPSS
jgi:hypothetical protein